MRTLLAILFLITSTASAETTFTSSLPSGKVKVDVMQLMGSPRLNELTTKLQTAVQQNKDWWMAHVQKAKPGEALPWDARLGLTRSEYEEFLKSSRDVQLGKAREAEIEFARSPDGRITVRADSSLPELEGIVINVKNDFVETPFGRTNTRSDITASEEQRTTGPWTGVQWKLESLGETPGTGTIVKFALGKLTRDGRGILYYDAKEIKPGPTGRKASRIIVFRLAK